MPACGKMRWADFPMLIGSDARPAVRWSRRNNDASHGVDEVFDNPAEEASPTNTGVNPYNRFTMKHMIHRALAALKRPFQTDSNFEDAYLAGAVDIYDLERRMSQLDRRDTQRPFHLQLSL